MPPNIRVGLICLVVLTAVPSITQGRPYDCEPDLIEVMFTRESQVRLRGGALVDLRTDAVAGIEGVVGKDARFQWSRACDVPEQRLDELQSLGQIKSASPVYNLNNIYRLRIPDGRDVWELSARLEALPGIIFAGPVPKPIPPASPPIDYEPLQGYLRPAASTPTGIDAEYAWVRPGGDGTGVTVCDLEYSWNYSHADISKAAGSQLNTNVSDPFNDENHGTAVLGILAADRNAWGTTGICHGADLATCGVYYGSPSPSWNLSGAIAIALANLSPGDVILIELQWDYGDPATPGPDYVPIEWWTNTYPFPQSFNSVYAAIENAVANGVHVIEIGGNGNVDTDALTWYGNSGAIIVGAGGVSAAGSWPEGDLERLSFSSFGSRYDLQGWGEDVVTTGYGDFYSAEGVDYWYTDIFAGTSSSGATVAGAVACLMGYYKAVVPQSPVLSPADLRDALIVSGTPQRFPPNGAIGPRPDLRAAIDAIPIEDFCFLPAVSYALNARTHDVVAADLDGDGDIDLAVTCVESKSVAVLKNNGTGVFDPPAYRAVTNTPWSIAAVDVNNDADNDLVVGTDANVIRILSNDGTGSFPTVIGNSSGGLQSQHVAGADFDADSSVDLVAANVGSNTISVLINNGSGTFFLDGTYATSATPAAVATVDMDGDTLVDVIVVTGSPGTIQVFTNTGGGSLSGPVTTNWGTYNPTALYAVDLDYDDDQDLVIVATFSTGADAVRAWRNNGDGTLGFSRTYGVGDAPGDVLAVDLNGDYRPDLVITNRDSDNLYLFKNVVDPGWDFSGPQILATGDHPHAVAAADLNDDGRTDLIIANRDDSTVSILINCGIPFMIGDMNADGIFDVLDVVMLVAHVFRNGDPPFPPFRADVNCDDVADVFDVVTLVAHVFRNRAQPECP